MRLKSWMMKSGRSNKPIVFDMGPLIALARLDSLKILSSMFSEVCISEQVWLENQAHPGRKDASIDLIGQIQVREPTHFIAQLEKGFGCGLMLVRRV